MPYVPFIQQKEVRQSSPTAAPPRLRITPKSADGWIHSHGILFNLYLSHFLSRKKKESVKKPPFSLVAHLRNTTKQRSEGKWHFLSVKVWDNEFTNSSKFIQIPQSSYNLVTIHRENDLANYWKKTGLCHGCAGHHPWRLQELLCQAPLAVLLTAKDCCTKSDHVLRNDGQHSRITFL